MHLMKRITPWFGKDTAKHYQWYPFINIGHYELAKQVKENNEAGLLQYYKQGIQLVWNKAKQNAFYRGIPFIWCSNNLTSSFAIQCYWYKQLTGDKTFDELEQQTLIGCLVVIHGAQAWSMVYRHGVILPLILILHLPI
jgi:hypothetical protein